MSDNDASKAIAVEPVSEWLTDNIEGAVGPFSFDFITGGHSNLTFAVTGADNARFVLRRPPLGSVLATAHDMAREYKIISGVGQTSVPVPQALGVCEDEAVNGAPFYVMSYIDGAVLHSSEDTDAMVAEGDVRSRISRSVVDVLADLHLANPDQIGLGDLGRKEAYLDRQLKRWRTQWEKSKTRDLPQMEQCDELLVAAKPEQHHTGIVHGDYRLGNMLVNAEGGTVEGVLDWELCTLGDVLADVGYLLNNWAPPGEESARGATAYATASGGFWTREQMVEAYSERTGFEVTNIEYYRAFQAWRLAAIVEGVLARYLKGVMGDDSVDTDLYKEQVESLADEALALLRSIS